MTAGLRPGPYRLLMYDYVEGIRERRLPHREAHLTHLRAWMADGRLLAAGAIGDPPHGAALVFGGQQDTATIEAFVAADPYVVAELVTGWRVLPWEVVG